MRKFKFYVLVSSFALCALSFIGCATVPSVMPTKPEGMPGIYHRVEKDQTLWRISKMYNTNIDELARVNHLSDTSNLEVGQFIFIPHRQKQEPLKIDSSLEDFIWPARGRVIAAYGQTVNNMTNKGINIQPSANLDVVASRSGKAVFCADSFSGYGKTLILDHGDGFLTIYARNAELFIKAGDYVQKGSLIARVGQSGRDKNRYLHFEIRKGYASQNPSFYLSRKMNN